MTGYHTSIDSEWLTLGCHSPLLKFTTEPFRGQSFRTTFSALYQRCSQGKSLIEINAPSGSGTTTLLRTLMKATKEQPSVYCHGSKGLTPSNLCKAISLATQITMTNYGTTKEPATSLLKKLVAFNKTIRVFIDDAHRLPQETARLIQHICNIQPKATQIQFICAFKQMSATNQQWLQLKNFSFDETKDYLLSLIPQTTNLEQLESVFTSIYQETEGNVSKIIASGPSLLKQHLTKHQLETSPPKQTSKPSRRFQKTYLVLSTLVVATLGAIGTKVNFSPKKTWAVQIAAMPSSREANQMIEQLPNHLQSLVFTYQTIRNQAPSTIVLLGPFTDKDQASSAIQNQVPDWVKKSNPWPRAMAAIQKEMYNFDQLNTH